ncbi:sodium-dependent glucose transporter 1A [Galendromus occidentalis]|uniref:Major facilitator superfamily domain-containing protein 4A n=1 Tax=Galendromus occidentalis TaxID=34638 RepID=A0AAJ6QRZ4_9ACAR|nr:sodium-dependent glucose transporter 1A [Galendromus occidentalis]
MLKLQASPALVALFQTANINILVFGLGCIFGLTGATLIDLGEVYNTPPRNVALIITTRGIGSIVFCLLGGAIFRHFNMQHVAILSALAMAIGMGMTPLWGKLSLCHISTFFVGGGVGLIETAMNFWIFAIWKEKSGPVFQFTNFCFGVGGVIAPFVAEPFLDSVKSSVNVTLTNSSNAEILPLDAETRVFVPYLIIGAVFAVAAVLCIASYLMDGSNICVSETDANDSCCSRRWQLLMVGTFSFYVLTIVGQEQTYISMLALFVVRHLKFSKPDSVYVSAAFWIFFTSTRVVATVVSFRMRPRSMLIICHLLVVLATGALCLFVDSATEVVWICTAIVGTGVSPMFPSALTHVLQYVHINQSYSSFIMMCVCVGGMLPPILVGPFIDDRPIAFVYVNSIIAVFSGIALIGLLVLPRGRSMRPSMMKK